MNRKSSDSETSSRKALRKALRIKKRQKKAEYFSKLKATGKFVESQDFTELVDNNCNERGNCSNSVEPQYTTLVKADLQYDKEKEQEQKLQEDMQKQWQQQLVFANEQEDKNIKALEKKLNINKKKKRALAQTFAADGLDYLLELCDSDNRSGSASAEFEFDDVNGHFDEDLDLMTSSGWSRDSSKMSPPKKTLKRSASDESREDQPADFESDEESSTEPEESNNADTTADVDSSEVFDSDYELRLNYDETDETMSTDAVVEPDTVSTSTSSSSSSTSSCTGSGNLKVKASVTASCSHSKAIASKATATKATASKATASTSSTTSTSSSSSSSTSAAVDTEPSNSSSPANREDIYGRKRDRFGNIIKHEEVTEKYVPPAVRSRTKSCDMINVRLKRQLKGLINRLAESNMHNICNQIESLFMTNSRNDMNETLTALMFETLLTKCATPERLLLEHILLVTILHANVGSEVGAHFLQSSVKQLHNLLSHSDIEDKRLDNAVNIVAQLYNFKLFNSQLLYDLLGKLLEKFEEKHVECILNILKSVGFTLRKEDPVALRTLIGAIQKRAANEVASNNPRVKFMLDILLAIKNNNMNKIPNYDNSYCEHLKKISKSFIRKGNYVTQLNINLEDLLKVDEQGKWWVVGSAWTGKQAIKDKNIADKPKNVYSQKLLQLAKKQRMNTDTRRNIFCIILSAEDYVDAFEKLMHLGLKNLQEREIINVLLQCCLSEKKYNPYYAILCQKFCDHNRKYQIMIKFSIWDKLKILSQCTPQQISNLAKLLTHLFIEKGLSISTLKIVQFGELDKITLRFMRQILIGILCWPNLDQCQEVFQYVAQSDKLRMFRDSLRLFIHHFLLKNLKAVQSSMKSNHQHLLEERAHIVEKLLTTIDRRQKLA